MGVKWSILDNIWLDLDDNHGNLAFSYRKTTSRLDPRHVVMSRCGKGGKRRIARVYATAKSYLVSMQRVSSD